ncbi:MAG: triphosphoribosyl-dephospho-CoA synthase [Methanobacteriaceae archaeon]|nr:triphosphoribosyl-dephospho-CoA synthase [Methanobacteriaceae archaeon]
MDPILISKIAQIASVLEVSGHPKPGNVHRTHDFEDMVFEDFLISGIVIGEDIKKAAQRGLKYKGEKDKFHQIKLGKLIKDAVMETSEWIANNTNLGIVMLLIPISAAAGMSSNLNELRNNVENIMKKTTPQDAVELYDAINIADAGGMGKQEKFDVTSHEAKNSLLEKNVSMYDVLKISSKWDLLAFELTHKMPVTFELGFPTFLDVKAKHGINRATVQTFLTILSKYPDTLISRKYDDDVAGKVSQGANNILKEGGILTNKGLKMLESFDQELIKNQLNPGTTADLTASSIMVGLLSQFMD